MSRLVTPLAKYAEYHRDPRNIATHFVGIPMIVLAVILLLSRPLLAWQGVVVTPAMGAALLALAYYLRLDLAFAALMGLCFALGIALGLAIGAWSTAAWLGLSLGLFVVGWALQFLGHWFEGRKPAFVDDLNGLLIGPLFVLAEAGFALGLRGSLREAIEARAGGLRRRNSGAAPHQGGSLQRP